MARQSLGDLLGNLDDKPALAAVIADVPEAEPLAAAEPVEVVRKPLKVRAPRPAPTSAARAAVELPTYLRLVRKETRLREDQQNQLTLEARRLNRAKAAGTPRITDNTLIRIAVDLLLERVARASGDDESSILRSLNR